VAETKRQVAVVGGGVIGVCTAYFLAKGGAQVTLLERDEIGMGASYGNAGTIAPGHAPINKPGRVKQALRSLFDPLSPLYIVPRWDPALIRWLWVFIRHCSRSHLERSMGVLAPLGHATAALFEDLVATEQLDCHYQRKGYYDVYLNRRALAALQPEIALLRSHGYRPEVLDNASLRSREPALNDCVCGGIFYPEAATVNPHRFVRELAERAGRYGVSFRSGSRVVELLVERARVCGVRLADSAVVRADTVVLATGAHDPALVRKLGYRMPLQPAKGYHLDRVPRAAETPALVQPCVLGESAVFCTPMDGFVRFAGTLEFSGVNHVIRRPRLEQLTRAASRYLDGVGEGESESEWCGLRPCLPDGLPAIGPLPRCPGLFVATGHAMMGLTLGPVTGKLIAEWILDRRPSINLDALRPDRF
jgi:D-amino-acid dehydrogenase